MGGIGDYHKLGVFLSLDQTLDAVEGQLLPFLFMGFFLGPEGVFCDDEGDFCFLLVVVEGGFCGVEEGCIKRRVLSVR